MRKGICKMVFVLGMMSAAMATPAQAIEPGETIVYDIKKLVKIGSATLEYRGTVEFEGRMFNLVVFTAKAPAFYDQETIYLDPETWHPVCIFRDLDIFKKKEKIEERYFPLEHRVEVRIQNKADVKMIRFQKDKPLDNIYGIIYRYRQTGEFAIGDQIQASLPTKEVRFIAQEQDVLTFAGQTFNTLYLKGDPANFGFWFSTDERKIPLRINGALGAIKARLEFREYFANQEEVMHAKMSGL